MEKQLEFKYNSQIIKAESHDGLQAKDWWFKLSFNAQSHLIGLYNIKSIEIPEEKLIDIFLLENEKKADYHKMFTDEFVIENSEYWDQEPQVDFDLLKQTIEEYNLSPQMTLLSEERENLLLFFKQMKKSSFAHKASKLL